MKKVVLNYLVIAAMAALVSCGGGSGNSRGGGKSAKIKMTTEHGGEIYIGIVGSGTATVDWGDSSEKVTLTLKEEVVEFNHTYPNATIRTITINGDNITRLSCRDFTSLDVSRCTELTELNCFGGSYTSLDVSKNIALINLHCSNSLLINLDVSKNTALTNLYCTHNSQLTTINASKNTALTNLNCTHNSQLTTLDVSKNSTLTYLDCRNCQLTTTALNTLFGMLHSNAWEKIIVIYGNPGTSDFMFMASV